VSTSTVDDDDVGDVVADDERNGEGGEVVVRVFGVGEVGDVEEEGPTASTTLLLGESEKT
jgi:hypothetical protein